MGCSCCRKSSDERKNSSKETKTSRRIKKWNPLACLVCRGEKVKCCSWCDKPLNENKDSSRKTKERKEGKNGDRLTCLPCKGEKVMREKSSDAHKKSSRKTKERKDGKKMNPLACIVCRRKSPINRRNLESGAELTVEGEGHREGKPFPCPVTTSKPKRAPLSRHSPNGAWGDHVPSLLDENKESSRKTKEHRVMGCSCCAKSSSDENKESSRKTKEHRLMGCSCCAKSSDESMNSARKTKERKEEKKRDRSACLVCRGERAMGCLCCTKSLEGNMESSRKTKEQKKDKKRDRFTCFFRRGECGCLCCAKSSDKNKASLRNTKERKEGKKRNPIACLVCRGERLRCCSCCVKLSDENKKSSKKKIETRKGSQLAFLVNSISFNSDHSGRQRSAAEAILKIGNDSIAARVFQFHELAAATKNFKAECLVGEGGFGRVYRGKLEDTNQIVAVKQLDRNGFQGNREFLVEVLMLSLLHHPNLVKLLGYCTDGDQRILVYEYMPLGSLEDHLLVLSPPTRRPLDWNTRMKIVLGTAKGLEYLHDIANPPVIYRDMKASNILLDEAYNPKLSDFGLAKLGPVGDKSHVSTRVMGTYGYCAPEYALTGQLTKMSDVYSFGVVFLEIITGRRAFDITRPRNEQQLVHWAGPLFQDKRNFVKMADPLLEGNYPLKGLYQAVAVAAMCLQNEASTRPRISDVVTAVEYLSRQTDELSEVPKESTTGEIQPIGSEIEVDTSGKIGGSDKRDVLKSQPNSEGGSCLSTKEELKQGVDVT